MRDAKSDDGADGMAEYSAEKESAPGVVIGSMPSMCLQRVLFCSLALVFTPKSGLEKLSLEILNISILLNFTRQMFFQMMESMLCNISHT